MVWQLTHSPVALAWAEGEIRNENIVSINISVRKRPYFCGLWFVVCGLWFVVCGLWFVVS